MRDQSRCSQTLIPISFSCSDLSSGPVEHSTRAVRILNNGFVITSPRRLTIGSLLSLRLRISPEASGGPFWESRCIEARVIAERTLHDGAVGYKVELELPG